MTYIPTRGAVKNRVVLLNPYASTYESDLVQNDPWLRGNETRMYSHGAAADEQMMAHYYPELHSVYTDRYGTVWSQSPAPGSPTVVGAQ